MGIHTNNVLIHNMAMIASYNLQTYSNNRSGHASIRWYAIEYRGNQLLLKLLQSSLQVWFTEKVQEQKRRVRKFERTWRSTKCDYHWKVLCEERKKYNKLIKATKLEKLSVQIITHKGEVKEL